MNYYLLLKTSGGAWINPVNYSKQDLAQMKIVSSCAMREGETSVKSEQSGSPTMSILELMSLRGD